MHLLLAEAAYREGWQGDLALTPHYSVLVTGSWVWRPLSSNLPWLHCHTITNAAPVEVRFRLKYVEVIFEELLGTPEGLGCVVTVDPCSDANSL